MPRPARRDPVYDHVLPREVLLDGSYWDLPVRNFFSLYGLEVVTGYADGRIKARTANGKFLDLPRERQFYTQGWVFDVAQWVKLVKEADRA